MDCMQLELLGDQQIFSIKPNAQQDHTRGIHPKTNVGLEEGLL